MLYNDPDISRKIVYFFIVSLLHLIVDPILSLIISHLASSNIAKKVLDNINRVAEAIFGKYENENNKFKI